ncbi:MAG TPA: SprT family zinc-dependent metalloprotease [Rhizomicrobium sp.]|nr:SprT family zinc-dependent metalloprotease [Rhizomicrobium sp.]
MLKSSLRGKPKAKRREKRAVAANELLAVDGVNVAVSVKLNARARRIVMRVHPASGEVIVTAPARGGAGPALAFARRETQWIARQLKHLPEKVELMPGAEVPYLGASHPIRHSPTRGPGPVWTEGGAIMVSGRIEHAPRRLLDFFKQQARLLFAARALDYAARLGTRPQRITVRDTKSRWGSCSQQGALSFCWRLVFAPDYVRDYVVAHEVAHLKEMNHSPRFWAHVRNLSPDTARARQWLRDHGRNLLRYN